jgi:cytochrome P450
MSTYKYWISESIAGAFLLRALVAPRYSILHSNVWTGAILFALHWLVYGFYMVIIYPKFISPLRDIPSVPGGSFFNGQWPALTAEPSGIPPRRWANEIPNDGMIRYLQLFNRERLLITSPKALAEVLTTKSYDFIKPELIRLGLVQVLGVGILLAEGDEHKAQRKNLAPAFNFRHVKELYPIFWSKSRKMVECIESDLSKSTDAKPSIEVGEWASRAALDIIGVAGMGQDFNALTDPNNELNTVYRSVFQPSRAGQILGLLQFFLPNFIIRNLPVKRNSNIHAASTVARDTSRRLVEQKRLRLANKEKMHPDIISIALESGGFTDDELVNNMMTFLAAGHETTASAFTWAVYLLCQNQDAQKRLRDEIHAHIPHLAGSSITSDILDNLPYLHAVCQEVLRIYAPVPLTMRDAAHDTTIQGHFVPKGTKIILSPWAINHNRALWGEDASEFKPERWTQPGQANAGGAVSNYAFMTFLHGPRSCIGLKFAQAEFMALIACFFGAFEVELVDKDYVPVVKGGITARPRDGVPVFVKRTEW